MRSSNAVVAIAAVVIITGLCLWYSRPWRNSDVIGVDWPASMRVAKCVGPLRMRICMSNYRVQTAVTFTTLRFNSLTRAPRELERNVIDGDSTTWAARVDSARRAIVARHEPTLSCINSLTGRRIAEAWALGGREVRLSSMWYQPKPPAQPVGIMSAKLVPRGAFGCDREWRVVWPTPVQMARAIRLWVEDYLGF